MMHGPEKSDLAIVAVKPTNKAERSAAESVEPRAGTKGNAGQQSTRRTQSRVSVSQALERIRQPLAVKTRGGSRMRESRTYGSVRGARGNSRPYRGSHRKLGDLVVWPPSSCACAEHGGPHREGEEPKPMMHGHEKSDSVIVAVKPTNKAERSAAELVEPRAGTKGNAAQQSTRQTPSWASVSQALDRLRLTALTARGRHDPRWEPYAGKPHVRICAGGAGRLASLPLRRREFIGLVGGAIASPFSARRSQQVFTSSVS